MSLPPHVLDPAFDNLRHDFDAACRDAVSRARSEQLQHLNQLFRRFRAYQTESDWVQTTLEAASPHADFIAVFSIANNTLRLRGQSPSGVLPEDISFPVSSAASFASAIESRDTVTALRSAGEVSKALSEGHATERSHLFPITNGDRVSGVLFASDSGSDVNALELIAGIASSVLERKANIALHAQLRKAPSPTVVAERIIEPPKDHLPVVQRQLNGASIPAAPALAVPIMRDPLPVNSPRSTEQPKTAAMAAGAAMPSLSPVPAWRTPLLPLPQVPPVAPPSATYPSSPKSPQLYAEPKLPAWTDLPMDQRQFHVRAQRFARVAVAEMQLARPEACRAGREQGDLYLFLKREIDKARENYRSQFMTVPSMVDYLHLELIQTAAQGNEQKLGADYPGRLL